MAAVAGRLRLGGVGPWHSTGGRQRALSARPTGSAGGRRTRGAARAEALEEGEGGTPPHAPDAPPPAEFGKELSKVVKKTATTFAPRASQKTSNPAVPGSTLYTIFEVQGYASAAIGGLLAFNLLFPSDGPDIWRLMGMWSVWMFTIPSLRARNCSPKEKEALNYLFLIIPLLNVSIPLVYKSFGAVWAADIVAFAALYAWKMNWFKVAAEDQ